jgi:hypothetical protein
MSKLVVSTIETQNIKYDSDTSSVTIAADGTFNHKAPAGQIINCTHFKNSTKTSLSNVSSLALWSGINVTKLIAQSKLIITGLLVFEDGNSYFTGEYWKIGSSGNRYDGIVQHGYASDAGDANVQFGWQINAEYDATETGSLAVEIGWQTANGGNDTPGITWNPNTTNDPRAQQKASTLTIFEVAK